MRDARNKCMHFANSMLIETIHCCSQAKDQRCRDLIGWPVCPLFSDLAAVYPHWLYRLITRPRLQSWLLIPFLGLFVAPSLHRTESLSAGCFLPATSKAATRRHITQWDVRHRATGRGISTARGGYYSLPTRQYRTFLPWIGKCCMAKSRQRMPLIREGDPTTSTINTFDQKISRGTTLHASVNSIKVTSDLPAPAKASGCSLL